MSRLGKRFYGCGISTKLIDISPKLYFFVISTFIFGQKLSSTVMLAFTVYRGLLTVLGDWCLVTLLQEELMKKADSHPNLWKFKEIAVVITFSNILRKWFNFFFFFCLYIFTLHFVNIL